MMANGQVRSPSIVAHLAARSDNHLARVEIRDGLAERHTGLQGARSSGTQILLRMQPPEAHGGSALGLVADEATDHVVGLVISLHDDRHLYASSCAAADLSDQRDFPAPGGLSTSVDRVPAATVAHISSRVLAAASAGFTGTSSSVFEDLLVRPGDVRRSRRW